MPSVTKSLLIAVTLAAIGDAAALLPRAGTKFVTGIPVPAGQPVPQRLEIREFIKDTTRLNLFLLSLERLQSQRQSEAISFYQISGIHGTRNAWDGDNGGTFGNQWGYCRHQDLLFPTWHRPYMSLYEQSLYEFAKQIVSEFPEGADKTSHQAALNSFRIPYWDWAFDRTLPDIMGATEASEQVTVNKPKVGQVKIHNPLFSYKFPTQNDQNALIRAFDGTRANTVESVRNPTNRNGAWANRPQYTNNEMVKQNDDLRNYVFNMFSRVKDYTSMSNMGSGSQSIEGVHGTIHITVGGLQSQGEVQGHMTNPQIAAFDPLFYMHHANVDRLFALWQAINPNSYLPAASSRQQIHEDTELHPFRRDSSSYWTSKSSRDVKAFGYTYPELAASSDPRTIAATVARLYGGASAGRSVSDVTESKKIKRQEGSDDSLHTPPDPAQLQGKVEEITNGTSTYNEYIANIKAPNSASHGSFKLFVFLGDHTKNIKDFTMDPNYVGSFDVFVRDDLPASHEKDVQGSVTLTNALLTLVGQEKIKDMQPETVADYLKSNFKVMGTGADGSDVDTSNVHCKVDTAKVTIPSGDNVLPQWGELHEVFQSGATNA